MPLFDFNGQTGVWFLIFSRVEFIVDKFFTRCGYLCFSCHIFGTIQFASRVRFRLFMLLSGDFLNGCLLIFWVLCEVEHCDFLVGDLLIFGVFHGTWFLQYGWNFICMVMSWILKFRSIILSDIIFISSDCIFCIWWKCFAILKPSFIEICYFFKFYLKCLFS